MIIILSCLYCQELLSVSSIESIQDRFVIYDRVGKQLVVADNNLDIIERFHSFGNGPGEINRISSFRVVGDIIYIVDSMSRKVIRTNLSFEAAHDLGRFNFIIRDLVPFAEGFFVVGWDPSVGKMVHYYDMNLKREYSFGDGLEDEQLLGSQAGSISVSNGHIIFSHTYLPYFDIFTAKGLLIKRVPLPLGDEPLISFSLANGNDNRYAKCSLYCGDGEIGIKIHDYEVKTAYLIYLFRYNLTSGEFAMEKLDSDHLHDRAGNIHRIIFNNEDMPIKIVKGEL